MSRTRVSVSLALLVLALCSACIFGGDNFCPNPGFEEGGGPAGPKVWEGTPNHVAWDDQVFHSGKRSAKITSEGGATVGWTSDPIPLPRPGCRFVFEGWAKLDSVSEGGGALMVLYTIGKDGKRNGQTGSIRIGGEQSEASTKPWTRFVTLSDVLKPDVHSVRVNVRLYKAKGTAWFDDLSLRLHATSEITKARPIRHEISMVADGRPTAAIVPGSEGKGCAEQIRKAIHDGTGVALPIVPPAQIDMANEKRDLILLGNLQTNPCVEYLYRRSYTYEDRYYPGGGGYVIRPLPNILGTGANILVLGASDDAGLKKGAADLVERIKGNAKPGRLAPELKLTVCKGESYKGRRYFPWSGSPPRREMNPTVAYLKDGVEEAAPQYRELILDRWFVPDDVLFARDLSLHLRYTTKTQSWDLMETCGVFSDEERLRITKRLLDMMRSNQGYEYGGLRPGMHSRENHGIRAAKGFYFGYRYFKKYYADVLGVEIELWEKKLRGFWKSPFSSARSFEDSLSQHAFAGSLDNTLTVGMCEPTWSKEYFEKSYARKTGERCIAVCNNMGEVVQQGDTSSSDYPADVFAKLAYLFHDGRCLFMLRKRRLGSSSDDPFQGFVIDLDPEVPSDHIGVRVIPADEVFYNMIHKQRTKTPLEKAFDKLTFRAGFDEDDPYLLLDGTAGGSHSYDDANTIGEFSQHGRIWLCQVDQFNGPTMNFHNAVAVARDGLGMVRVPGCAELVTAAQGKTYGYTATALREYNGVDWVRHVFWLKKRFFFVLDELRAREPGSYAFVCNWRGLGDARLEPGLYSVSEAETTTAKLHITADRLKSGMAETSGKTSKLLGGHDSLFYRSEEVGDFLETRVNVPEPGEYGLFISGLHFTGRGVIQVSVDGKPVGKPIDQRREGHPRVVQIGLGPVRFDAAGDHTIRFEVVKKHEGEKACHFAIRALDLFRSGERKAAGTSVSRRFCLRFPAGTAAGLDVDTEVLGPYLNPHVWHDQALNVLTQSRGSQLAKDEAIAFQNMFWSSKKGSARSFELRRLNEHTALIRSDGDVALIGGVEPGARVRLEGLAVDARFFYIDPKRYVFVAPQAVDVAGEKIRTGLDTNAVEGEWASEQTGRAVAAALAKAWQAAGARPTPGDGREGKALQPLKAAWTTGLPSDALCMASRGAGAAQRIAVGSQDGVVREFGRDGKLRGQFKTNKPVHALCAFDLDGDGTEELLVGSDDERVSALDGELKPKWTHQVDFLRDKQIWMWWTLGSSKVRRIHCDDITGDGVPEVIVGAGNMHLNVLNSKGEHLWRFRSDHGIPTTITTADILGDGRRLIVYGNGLLSSNGTCWVLDAEGKRLKAFYNDSWCSTLPAIAVGDPDGDGKKTVFCGNNRGNLRAYDPKGDQRKPLWIHNLAGPVRQIVLLPKADGRDGLVVAASDSGCLTAFRENGDKAWVATLGAAVVAVGVMPDGRIAAGCKDGTLYIVSPDGKAVAALETGEQLQDLLCKNTGEILAITKRKLLTIKP